MPMVQSRKSSSCEKVVAVELIRRRWITDDQPNLLSCRNWALFAYCQLDRIVFDLHFDWYYWNIRPDARSAKLCSQPSAGQFCNCSRRSTISSGFAVHTRGVGISSTAISLLTEPVWNHNGTGDKWRPVPPLRPSPHWRWPATLYAINRNGGHGSHDRIANAAST